MSLPSQFDNDTFQLARNHLNDFINRISKILEQNDKILLEIGPQKRSEVQEAFKKCTIKTLDIVDKYKPDIIGDITRYNSQIPDSSFDYVTCLEILEHTVNPFAAINELRRIVKNGGYILFSAPLNWRIHGPVPDCWRFTEFGWRVLLKDFDIVEVDKLNSPDRNLFPIKYNILARCDKNKNVDVYSMKFDLVD
jgi:SAM-dependent methyltransferase